MTAAEKDVVPTMKITETAITITPAAPSFFWNSKQDRNLHLNCNAWFVTIQIVVMATQNIIKTCYIVMMWTGSHLVSLLPPFLSIFWTPCNRKQWPVLYCSSYDSVLYFMHSIIFQQYYTTSHSPILLLPSIAFLWVLNTKTQITNRKIHAV